MMATIIAGCAIGWLALTVVVLVFNRGCEVCRKRTEAAIATQPLDEDAALRQLFTNIDLARRDFRETP